MGWVAGALMIGGALLEAKGAAEEARATTMAAKYNAKVSMMQAQKAANQTRSQAKVIRGRNLSRVSKSGVRLEGSPLSTLANNAYNAERAAQNAMRTGEAQKRIYLMEGDAARTAGQYRQASALIGGVSNLLGAGSGGKLFGAKK